jgi:hypothetical protein
MAGVSGWGRIRGNTMVLLRQGRDKIVRDPWGQYEVLDHPLQLPRSLNRTPVFSGSYHPRRISGLVPGYPVMKRTCLVSGH